jgi:hypothetical protein
MARHDLHVERVFTSVDVVLDANVRELDVPPIVTRQVMLSCPVEDLIEAAARTSVAVVTIAIGLLEELLVLPLEIVFEDDAVDMRAIVSQPLGFVHVGPIKVSVVLQLARLLNAVMKRLSTRRVLVEST